MKAARQPLVIFGAADFAQVAAACLDDDGGYDVMAFTVHRRFRTAQTLDGRDVIPFEELARAFPPGEAHVLVAVGYREINRVRARICDEVKAAGYDLATYVSQRVVQTGPTAVGENSFVMPAVVLDPFVSIGRNVVIWSASHIAHHTTIEDNCFLGAAAHIGSHVTVKRNAFIGQAATVQTGLTIAEESLIGDGATIGEDTVAGGVYSRRRPGVGPVKSWEIE